MRSSDLLQGKVVRYFTATLFITLRRVQISQICVRYEQCRPPEQAAPNGGYVRVEEDALHLTIDTVMGASGCMSIRTCLVLAMLAHAAGRTRWKVWISF
jgi:hypothetical protein